MITYVFQHLITKERLRITRADYAAARLQADVEAPGSVFIGKYPCL